MTLVTSVRNRPQLKTVEGVARRVRDELWEACVANFWYNPQFHVEASDLSFIYWGLNADCR
jgi:hypothetical protein